MRLFALALGTMLLWPVGASAWTPQPTGVLPSITWINPTTNTDGSPLTDLARIEIYWRLGVTGVETTVNHATTSQGATLNRSDILIPILPCTSQTVTVTLAAVDTSENKSTRTMPAHLLVNRLNECVPDAPSGLTVQ